LVKSSEVIAAFDDLGVVDAQASHV
jgi:hypothetical protein